MEYYILKEEWASIVRQFKDEEHSFGVSSKDAEDITHFLIEYIRKVIRFRMFTQKRGEEFEKLFIVAEQKGYPVGSLRRFIEEDDRWNTALELATQ
jgi:hypothetical protein